MSEFSCPMLRKVICMSLNISDLKYISKNNALNFEIIAFSPPCIKFLSLICLFKFLAE